MTYYTLTIFPEATEWGSTLKNKYKRFENVHSKFNSLVASRQYESVVLRKQEIWGEGSSCSSPIAIYTGARK